MHFNSISAGIQDFFLKNFTMDKNSLIGLALPTGYMMPNFLGFIETGKVSNVLYVLGLVMTFLISNYFKIKKEKREQEKHELEMEMMRDKMDKQ